MFGESRKRRDDGTGMKADDDGAEMDTTESGGGGDGKRRRMPAGQDIGPRLVKMIKKLDEDLNGASVESSIEKLADTLEENLDPYEGQIIHILYECAAYLPEKITVFSTLAGILNARSSDFGARLLVKFLYEFHNTFFNDEYDISVRLATFLCDLGNARVVTPSSILEFLEDFVDLAVEECVKSDFFIYLVLHTLPWIGPELSEKTPTKLNDLMDRIGLYLGRRKKAHIPILQVWLTSEFPQEDYLDSLWAQLLKLRENNWLEQHILRTYIFFDESILAKSTPHELPSLNREILKNSQNHPLPRIVFRLFEQSDCPETETSLPTADAIERFLVEEDLNWIIDNNYLDWKLCSRQLLNYHRRDTVPLNYVIIETIFSQLFRLPKAAHLELFYGALLIELCRSQANTMPQVLALAAELLYQRTDTMQPICLDRFVDWFSYHLSNFEYRWSWSDWAECIELDSLHPRRIFVREVIEKCLRFSYYKKLTEFLPPEMAPIIPDEPAIIYVLDDDQHPAYAKAEQLRELVMAKAGDEDILAALKTLNENEPEFGSSADQKPEHSADAVAIFFSVLLKLSSKTMTHSFAALTRYHKTLTSLTANDEEMQSTILRTLYDAWNLHKQMMTVLVDKMIKMRILDPDIVIAWVFSEEMKVEFKRSWVWDALSTAVTFLERQRINALRRYESGCEVLERLEQRLRKQQQQQIGGGAVEIADSSTTIVMSSSSITKASSGTSRNVKMEQGEGEEGEEEEEMTETQREEVGEANGGGTDGGVTQESSRPRVKFEMATDQQGGQQQQEQEGEMMEADEGGGGGDWSMGLDGRIAKQEDFVRNTKAELERCEDALRNVLLNICHKFTLILTEHVLNCESDGTEIETNFYNYVAGRLKYVFLQHAESMWHFGDDLDRELFSSPTIGPRIRAIFEQFRSLRS